MLDNAAANLEIGQCLQGINRGTGSMTGNLYEAAYFCDQRVESYIVVVEGVSFIVSKPPEAGPSIPRRW